MLRGTTGLWLALALGLFIPVSIGLGRASPSAALALLALCGLAVVLGRGVAIALNVPRRPGFIAAFELVAGWTGASLLLLSATIVLHQGAFGALAMTAAATALFLFFLRRRTRRNAQETETPPDGRDAAVVFAVCLLATLWSRQALTSFAGMMETGVFHAHADFFYHGAEVAYLRRFSAFAGQCPFLAGTPRSAYHEASYTMPAAFAALAGMPCLQSALFFWLPAGLVLMGVGAYGFGAALAGRWAGVAAALGLFLVPDASRYGLKNAFLSFHWLSQVTPAQGYGVAMTLAALGLFAAGLETARPGLLLAAAALAALTAAFKMQVALIAFPFFVILVLASWRPGRPWHRAAAAGVVVAAGAAAVLVFERIPLAPHFLTNRARPDLLFQVMDLCAQGPAAGLYHRLAAHAAPPLQGAAGAGILVAGAFGAILPALTALALSPFRARWRWQFHVLPFLLLAVYLAGVFLIPGAGNETDPTEFSHRPFGLVYAVLLATLMAEVVAIGRASKTLSRRRRTILAVLGLIAAGGLAESWVDSADAQDLFRIPLETHVPASPGLYRACRFVGEHGQPTDWVLASDADPRALVAAFSERPAFLSLTYVYLNYPEAKLAQVARERFRLGAAMQRMRTYAELREFGRRQGVRWFLLRPRDMPMWPGTMLSQCVYQDGGERVFDLEQPERPAS